MSAGTAYLNFISLNCANRLWSSLLYIHRQDTGNVVTTRLNKIFEKWIDVHYITGVNKVHEDVSNIRTMYVLVKWAVFSMKNSFFQCLFICYYLSGSLGTLRNRDGNGGRRQLCKLIIPTTPDSLLILILLARFA